LNVRFQQNLSPGGTPETYAGNLQSAACGLAETLTMPVIIRNLDDGSAFIAMEPKRERLKQFFTECELDATIINLNEIRTVLRDAGISDGQ
jgi:acylphosphatase